MPHIEFAVKGMHCDGCRRTLEDGLRSTRGVIGARVDLETESVTVEYDDKRIFADDLREAVRTAGFQVA
jgi:copper chaperone CopZ